MQFKKIKRYFKLFLWKWHGKNIYVLIYIHKRECLMSFNVYNLLDFKKINSPRRAKVVVKIPVPNFGLENIVTVPFGFPPMFGDE